MLTEKDYCDYDTCVALKKLGYNEKTLAYYTSEGFFHWIRAYIYDVAIPDLANSSNKKPYKHIIDAMSLYEAQKWLREVKNLFIEVFVYEGQCGYRVKDTLNEFYDRDLHYYDSRHVIRKEGFLFSSYEEALLAGIKEAIKILKEK